MRYTVGDPDYATEVVLKEFNSREEGSFTGTEAMLYGLAQVIDARFNRLELVLKSLKNDTALDESLLDFVEV